jgi:hypothetical protein
MVVILGKVFNAKHLFNALNIIYFGLGALNKLLHVYCNYYYFLGVYGNFCQLLKFLFLLSLFSYTNFQLKKKNKKLQHLRPLITLLGFLFFKKKNFLGFLFGVNEF